MKSLPDALFLQKLRLCRAEVVSAMTANDKPPAAKTLRELAELQLVIMATEAAIADKSDASFFGKLETKAA